MSVHGGITAFERLRTHLEDVARRCEDCGYDDDEGQWRVETSGRAITYRHVCPVCDAVSVRQIRLE